MEEATRTVLAMLADEKVGRILDACSSPKTERELCELTGASRATVRMQLRRLEDLGLVESDLRSVTKGRPPQVWSSTSQEVVRAFVNHADGLTLELLRDRADRQDAGIEERRRRETRPVASRRRKDRQ
jgi:DNA-binding FadR family transcriptional regulator